MRRRSLDMRAHMSLVSAALLVAGCATGGASAPRTTERSASEPLLPTPTRCSAGDPDRWAWFCVIGQALYGTAANLQPDAKLRSR